MWQRRSDELARLRAAFPCGTLGQAARAFERATNLGATEEEVERSVREGTVLMHLHQHTDVLVLRPAS